MYWRGPADANHFDDAGLSWKRCNLGPNNFLLNTQPYVMFVVNYGILTLAARGI